MGGPKAAKNNNSAFLQYNAFLLLLQQYLLGFHSNIIVRQKKKPANMNKNIGTTMLIKTGDSLI